RPRTLTIPRRVPRPWIATVTLVVRAFLHLRPRRQRGWMLLALMIVGLPIMFVVMHLMGIIGVPLATPIAPPGDTARVNAPASLRPKPPAPTKMVTKLVTNSVGMRLALINPGEYLMGSISAASADEVPQHRVRITRPFYLGVHEVTHGQYQA